MFYITSLYSAGMQDCTRSAGAAASRFGRPGKSAAAAAITTATQGVNEQQIELLE